MHALLLTVPLPPQRPPAKVGLAAVVINNIIVTNVVMIINNIIITTDIIIITTNIITTNITTTITDTCSSAFNQHNSNAMSRATQPADATPATSDV